jgi:hypothetical protein
MPVRFTAEIGTTVGSSEGASEMPVRFTAEIGTTVGSSEGILESWAVAMARMIIRTIRVEHDILRCIN